MYARLSLRKPSIHVEVRMVRRQGEPLTSLRERDRNNLLSARSLKFVLQLPDRQDLSHGKRRMVVGNVVHVRICGVVLLCFAVHS